MVPIRILGVAVVAASLTLSPTAATAMDAQPPVELFVYLVNSETIVVNLINHTAGTVAYEVAVDTADLDAKVTDLTVEVADGTLAPPDAFGVRLWTGSVPSGPFTDQVIQFEFDVIPPGPGVPAVTYSMAVWSQSESVGCKDNVPANCAVSSYLLHPSLVAAGDPALAKTGAAAGSHPLPPGHSRCSPAQCWRLRHAAVRPGAPDSRW